MLSSVAKFFTPGGRRGSGQVDHVVEQDTDVQDDDSQDNIDVVQDVVQDVVGMKLAPTVLFDKELDEKHVDIDRDFDAKYSDVSGSSSSLIKKKKTKRGGSTKKRIAKD